VGRRRLDAAADAQPRKDARHVCARGPLRDEERLGDLAVGPPVGDEREQRELAADVTRADLPPVGPRQRVGVPQFAQVARLIPSPGGTGTGSCTTSATG
jgi:hypothetical protein